MSTLPAHESALREVIAKGGAVIVAGTGVSIPASGSHPQASWKGLLLHGLDEARRRDGITADRAKRYQDLLNDKESTTADFLAAADAVTKGLGNRGSDHYGEWLQTAVGTITAKDRSILDPLEALHQLGHKLATTNYDSLLLGSKSERRAVSWNDPEFLTAARGDQRDVVLHLHGHWRDKDSVILGTRSYEEISRDEHFRGDLEAFWKMTTWVYVGCGLNGINDPDIGLLLDRLGERARRDGHMDYCLVLEKDRADFEQHFKEQGFNITAVAYGEKHEDLGLFLASLVPPPVPPPERPLLPPPVGVRVIPEPPDFYAKPDYIGRHDFVGRAAQLQTLTEWAKPTDATSILLFEAIGGNGKSMLTWEWTTKHADAARAGHKPWAGKFWYSFYEKGAIMRDFCLHALHYMTPQTMENLEKKPMAELRTELLAQLHARPWLLILDGLERVLVAYHRIDAAEVRDEEVNRPTDKILDRDPCDAIRPEDTELLRALTAAKPSKILISSRLIPRVLLNPSGLPLPGVRPLVLPGLDDADAERLFCEVCGIRGTSADIRYYLKTFCDNHPLVIGVLAGLINSPGPHRGHFDGWAAAPEYGAKLNLARLDLIQSRNHILRAAMDALEAPSRQLLSTLALLTDAVDYDTVAAFNPHLPPEPEEPPYPEEHPRFRHMGKAELDRLYDIHAGALKAYAKELQVWRDSNALREAPQRLSKTISDLEQCGLLQYDPREQRYDLHPVVRGVAAGSLKAEDKKRYGRKVVDHFNSLPHSPYAQAKTMEDVESGLQVVRTLLKLGHYQQAANTSLDGLAYAMLFKIEAHSEVLSMVRPFFSSDWRLWSDEINLKDGAELANCAGLAFRYCGFYEEALKANDAAIKIDIRLLNFFSLRLRLGNATRILVEYGKISKAMRINKFAIQIADLLQNDLSVFVSLLVLYRLQALIGDWPAAASTWQKLDPMGRDWGWVFYNQGEAEEYYARNMFWQASLREEHISNSLGLAMNGNSPRTIKALRGLVGSWRLEQGQWALAAASFAQAVTMARERRLVDEDSETGLALAKHHLGQLTGDAARSEAERLAGLRQPAHRTLAQLWLAIGDTEQAKHHALAAYRWACADGEPYVNRYELTKTTELLNELGVPIPNLPPYDPSKDEPFPWEADVRAAIEKLRKEKEERESAKQ